MGHPFLAGSTMLVSEQAVKISEISALHQQILSKKTVKEKHEYLSSLLMVQQYLTKNKEFSQILDNLPLEHKYVLKALIALGQGPVVFANEKLENGAKLSKLVDHLLSTERFYDYMGGIIGYHLKTLQLIKDASEQEIKIDDAEIAPVPYVDIRTASRDRNKLLISGIKSLESMAELYVLGGAGDRLGLKDTKTDTPLPVACLQFAGRTLLESLIRDLEAREFLYYKLFAKQLFVPIVLMTSLEKNNDIHIQAICSERGYFGRPKESIFRILQPLAPVLTVSGNWAVSAPYELVLKPGGHGVIWKLARDCFAFDWLKRQKSDFLIVRQINNPISGLDVGLLALAGFGKSNNKAFGFESCPRKDGMSEGMNVLRSKNNEYSISNIEYTEFAERKKRSPDFADLNKNCDFPTNTNILYVNIDAIYHASEKYPIPGLLVNMKHPVETVVDGKKVTMKGARLESTMQNIVDVMTDKIDGEVSIDKLQSFLLLNDREKTISVTKKAFDGKGLAETPEGCFYDLLCENRRLLKDICNYDIAEQEDVDDYIKSGPNTLFLYHPALGPLYSIIGQKISQGALAKGSELQIEAQEIRLKNVDIDGSLVIYASSVCGKKDPSTKLLSFGEEVGAVAFENVRICNKGIDRKATNHYWTNSITRHECCKIILEGHSECVAKDVTIEGDREIRVKDKERAVLSQNADGSLHISYEPLTESSNWKYTIDENSEIVLSR